MNGASTLLASVFGRQIGVGARSAIGTNVLPGNITVEIELILELRRQIIKQSCASACENYKTPPSLASPAWNPRQGEQVGRSAGFCSPRSCDPRFDDHLSRDYVAAALSPPTRERNGQSPC